MKPNTMDITPHEALCNRAHDISEHQGLRYVVMEDGMGTLAVYRVKNDGFLRRLRRYPQVL